MITGDTEPCELALVAAHEAELLVHEASFADDEAERAHETKHSTARQAAKLAAEAQVQMLALVHISSRYHVGAVLDEAREEFPGAIAPRDFDVIEIPFPERGEPRLIERGAKAAKTRPRGTGLTPGLSSASAADEAAPPSGHGHPRASAKRGDWTPQGLTALASGPNPEARRGPRSPGRPRPGGLPAGSAWRGAGSRRRGRGSPSPPRGGRGRAPGPSRPRPRGPDTRRSARPSRKKRSFSSVRARSRA